MFGAMLWRRPWNEGGLFKTSQHLGKNSLQGNLLKPEAWPVWVKPDSLVRKFLSEYDIFLSSDMNQPCFQLCGKCVNKGRCLIESCWTSAPVSLKNEHTPDLNCLKPLGWTPLNSIQNESQRYWGNCTESSRQEEKRAAEWQGDMHVKAHLDPS